MRTIDIVRYIDKLNQWKSNDEGWWYGEKDKEVRAVMVCWIANLEAVEKAAQLKCDLIVCHESPFFPYWPAFAPHLDISRSLTWKANLRKIKILSETGISIYRAHGRLDVSFNTDEFIRQAGICGSVEEFDMFGRTVTLPKSIFLRALAADMKKKLGLEIIRMVGDPRKKVKKIGIAIGGEPLSTNLDFCQRMVDYEVDVVTGGEFDEWSMQFFNDSEIACIETGHVFSENFGLKKFTSALQKKFKSIKVIFHDCPIPFSYF
jgi:putative NIF3 family GTP cyclohydrolase 1 type 2